MSGVLATVALVTAACLIQPTFADLGRGCNPTYINCLKEKSGISGWTRNQVKSLNETYWITHITPNITDAKCVSTTYSDKNNKVIVKYFSSCSKSETLIGSTHYEDHKFTTINRGTTFVSYPAAFNEKIGIATYYCDESKTLRSNVVIQIVPCNRNLRAFLTRAFQVLESCGLADVEPICRDRCYMGKYSNCL